MPQLVDPVICDIESSCIGGSDSRWRLHKGTCAECLKYCTTRKIMTTVKTRNFKMNVPVQIDSSSDLVLPPDKTSPGGGRLNGLDQIQYKTASIAWLHRPTPHSATPTTNDKTQVSISTNATTYFPRHFAS